MDITSDFSVGSLPDAMDATDVRATHVFSDGGVRGNGCAAVGIHVRLWHLNCGKWSYSTALIQGTFIVQGTTPFARELLALLTAVRTLLAASRH